MKKAAENSSEGRRIYIIEIMPRWHSLVAPDLHEGKRCFYVGETGKDIEERYLEHRSGEVEPGRREKRRTKVLARISREKGEKELIDGVDIRLLRSLGGRYPSVMTTEQSVELESVVIDEFRGKGHVVYPDTAGAVPFDKHRFALAG